MRARCLRVDEEMRRIIEEHRQQLIRENKRFVSLREASLHLARTYGKNRKK